MAKRGSVWRQWYIERNHDCHELEAWLRSSIRDFGPEYGFRADPPFVATNVPVTLIRRHTRGLLRLPADYTTLTYPEVQELFDGDQ